MAVREDMLSALCGGEITHVVILHLPGRTVPQEIESTVRPLCHSCPRFSQPLEAFAEIALHDRLDSTRSAWGLATPGITCLVIVEMASIVGGDELLSALARYFGKVAVVSFDGAARQTWRLVSNSEGPPRTGSNHPFRRQEALRAGTPAAELARRGPTPPPSLRLVDHRPANEGSSFVNKGDGRDPERSAGARARDVDNETQDVAEIDGTAHDVENDPVPSVTRDEIAMLLRGDAEDDDRAPEARREAVP